MTILKTGRIDKWGPKIFLGSAAGDIASVCLTAPDKSGSFSEQTHGIFEVIDELLSQMGTDRSALIYAQVWLAGIEHWSDFVPLWNDWVGTTHCPGLSVVEMAASRRDSRLEIRVWADRPATA